MARYIFSSFSAPAVRMYLATGDRAENFISLPIPSHFLLPPPPPPLVSEQSTCIGVTTLYPADAGPVIHRRGPEPGWSETFSVNFLVLIMPREPISRVRCAPPRNKISVYSLAFDGGTATGRKSQWVHSDVKTSQRGRGGSDPCRLCEGQTDSGRRV